LTGKLRRRNLKKKKKAAAKKRNGGQGQVVSSDTGVFDIYG